MKFFYTITEEGECGVECLCVCSAVHHTVLYVCALKEDVMYLSVSLRTLLFMHI